MRHFIAGLAVICLFPVFALSLDFGLRGADVDINSAYNLEVFVQNLANIRGVNVECTYDTGKIIIDSIRSILDLNFMTYINEIDTINGNIHAVSVYRGEGNQLVNGKLFSIYGRTKSTTGTAGFLFIRDRVALIDSNNNEIPVIFKDLNFNITAGTNKELAKNVTAKKYRISPNPFNGNVNFMFEKDFNPRSIRIYNVNGKMLKDIAMLNATITTYTWEPVGLPSGTYIAHMVNEKNVESERIIFSK